MIDVSRFAQDLNGKPVAVFGLGLSNRAAVKALEAAGVKISAGDDNHAEGTIDLLREDFKNYACLILAPGVPHEHPVVAKAHDEGIEIICDIEILHRCRHGRKTVGITGTNGKSTTTALIGHILKECGVPVAVGGNIGTPVLALDMPPEQGVFVLELSSYQLDLCPTFAPDIAVYLNLSPDHIDRHGTFENYAAAKARIFRGAGIAVTGHGIEAPAGRKNIPITTFDLETPSLRGVHNQQNMAAAFAVAQSLGLAEKDIIAAIKTFPGLPHRQYPVRVLGDVTYINDSKATNADATARALASFDDIYWIVGGKPKSDGLTGLDLYKDKIRHAFLIGEAASDFADWMTTHGVPFTVCDTMDRAIAAAHETARQGIVLLSPACASFDQFRNFEHRGDTFTALVNQLKEPTS